MTQTTQQQPGWQQQMTDPKAAAKAAKAYAKATRPWYKKKRFMGPLALVAVVAIAAGGSGGENGGANVAESNAAGSASDKQVGSAGGGSNTGAEKAAVAKESAPTETTAQENARSSAETYLSMSAFSRTGLIDQLKFEGYSVSDATYGVDSLKANWNEQAAESAENYLDMTAFSREGLIEQLEFEGYTTQQAVYGVNQTGL